MTLPANSPRIHSHQNDHVDCGDFEDDQEDDDDLHQVSGSTMVLTGGQLHPSLVTEYSGIDNGWQVMLKTKSRSISTVGGSGATCTRNFFELFFQNR